MTIKIKSGLILEDNTDAQLYLRDVLKTSFPDVVIDVASSLEQANFLLDKIRPDIALVDLNLPDGSGVEFLQRLTREIRDCIPIVTTIYDDDNHLFSALKAGAQGYLLKEQRSNQLVEALQGIVGGKPALTPKIAMKIMAHFSSTLPAQAISKDTSYEALSKRETQVLSLLAKGYSANQIADELFISYHTVTSHIKNIYAKLEISTRAEAAQKAHYLGLAD